jgi:hypothetical protein
MPKDIEVAVNCYLQKMKANETFLKDIRFVCLIDSTKSKPKPIKIKPNQSKSN